ncbi:hypothetical protein RSOL_289120, partial [Rhizoctonia solani AG-3 Rhs1AP]
MDYNGWYHSQASNTGHVDWNQDNQLPPAGNMPVGSSQSLNYPQWQPAAPMPAMVQHGQPLVPPMQTPFVGSCTITLLVGLSPGYPGPSISSASTNSAKVPQQPIPPHPIQADDDSEPELPEASQLLPRTNPNPAPAPVTSRIESNEEATTDQGHRPWTNDEIGAIIDGVCDPDHPEHYELAQAKGFNNHVAERWSQFTKEFLQGRRSGRATWTKFKEIKDTYREVRDLHTQTGNGGLLQLEDNDSKAETMQKLGIRLKKLESRVGKLKYVTNKEVYYNWVKGGQSSWFARMHARYGDDMALQRPIERSSGRLSPLIRIEATDDDNEIVAQPFKRGKKRKLGARSGSEAPDDPESTSSKANKLLDRMFDALPPSVPPSIHERRLALDEKKLEMEDKRADKNTSILEKRLELEIKQLEAESKRRQRRWDLEDEDRKRQDEERKRRCVLEDEDRKRRQAEDDSARGASEGRTNIEFLLKLSTSTVEGAVDNEAFRKHAESAAFTLVDALTRQTLEGLSKHRDVHLSADVDMDGNTGGVQNRQ